MNEENGYIFNNEISNDTDGSTGDGGAPYMDLLNRASDERECKSRFSRLHLGLCLYLLITTLASVIISLVASFIMPEETYLSVFGSYFFMMIMNAVTQYAIAFPAFYFFIRRVPKAIITERKRLSVVDFLLALLVAEASMYVGSIIGNALNGLFTLITGIRPDNSVEIILNEIPGWLIVVTTCVLAPIFEELIFRKLMLDRLSPYGEGCAILFSALAFSFLHGNLFQLFYTFLFGLVLGYVYSKTKNIIYPIVLHAIVNFLGSIVPLELQDVADKILKMTEHIQNGRGVDMQYYLFGTLALLGYSLLIVSLTVGGVVALIVMWKTKKIKLDGSREIYLSRSTLSRNAVRNAGFIIYYALCVISIIIALFPTA